MSEFVDFVSQSVDVYLEYFEVFGSRGVLSSSCVTFR